MRFATYKYDGRTYAGVTIDHEYYSFGDLLGDGAPETILEFLQQYENKPLPDFLSIISGKCVPAIPEEAVKLCAPIPDPFRSVFCVGKNYADHAQEAVRTGLVASKGPVIPEIPLFFAKYVSVATGDQDVISLHSHITKKVDYEVELGVVIGKTIKCVKPEQVPDAVFGYTIVNDVTARDAQTAYGQFFFGKSFDGFCPMGPVIVTKDELPSPGNLNVSCRVNGETRQSSNTSLLVFDIPRLVSELSQGITLCPGDIIATGTPGGIGHAMDPPVYFKKGDKVECEVEGIGVLTNTFE